MINFLVTQIKLGKITIEQIPDKWAVAVRTIIEQNS